MRSVMQNVMIIAIMAGLMYASDETHTGDMVPAHTMQHHQEMLEAQAPIALSKEMLNLMHEPMMEEPFLEDDNLDLNFLVNMIPHHQGAIDSAEFLLKHSKNKQLRTIATQIIQTQKAEIEEFKALIPELEKQKKLYSPKEVTLYNQQAKQDMETMHQEMSELALTERLNHDFLLSMIPHHEAAIKASKQILIYTQNEQIKAIAQKIIQVQEQEIEDFKVLLQKIH